MLGFNEQFHVPASNITTIVCRGQGLALHASRHWLVSLACLSIKTGNKGELLAWL